MVYSWFVAFMLKLDVYSHLDFMGMVICCIELTHVCDLLSIEFLDDS